MLFQTELLQKRKKMFVNSKLRDDTVLNLKALFVSVSKTINNGTKIIRTVLD